MLRRHGDIPIHPISALPLGETIKHNGSFTFAEGEATGHNHVLTIDDPDALQIVRTAEGIAFSISKPANVTHPEHGSFSETIPPGTYRFGKERERNPFLDVTQIVQD